MRGSDGFRLFSSSSSRSKTTDDLATSFKRVCTDRVEILSRYLQHRSNSTTLCHRGAGFPPPSYGEKSILNVATSTGSSCA